MDHSNVMMRVFITYTNVNHVFITFKKIYLKAKREKQVKLSGQRLELILYLGQIRNFELLLKFMLAKTLKISL